MIKIGSVAFNSIGHKSIFYAAEKGFEIFLDLKLHDIPNTVSRAVCSAAELGVWMTNVHASGGVRMMRLAKQKLIEQGSDMLLIGVTVLTSMDSVELAETGVCSNIEHQVLYLANQAKQSGLDGVVCSAKEARLLRAEMGTNFTLVTPGIRLPGDNKDDQRRVMEPRRAIKMGSNYLVIGRAITKAEAPLKALRKINQSLA